MTRFTFAAAALAALVGLGGAAHAAEVTLRLATIAPEKSIWTKMLNDYRDRVAELTDGEVDIELFTGGQLGNMADTMSQMMRGRIDIWAGASPVIASQRPEITVLMMPYLFENLDVASCTMDALYPHMQEKFQDVGEFLGFVPTGWHGISSLESVTKVEDLANRKIRTSSLVVSNKLIEAYGANAVPLSAADTASALSTGLVVGGDSTLIYWFGTGEAKIAKYMLELGHYQNTSAVIVGKRSWSKLSDSQKAAMVEARDAIAYPKLQAMYSAAEEQAKKLAIEQGAVFTTPEGAEREVWVKLGRDSWEPILDELGDDARAELEIVKSRMKECGSSS